MNKRILIIGPIPNPKHPKSIGGATILCKCLIDYCDSHNINYKLIVTNKYYGIFSSIKNLVAVLVRIVINVPFFPMVLCNLSSNGVKVIAPYTYLVCKIFRKPFYLRLFGSWIADLIGGNSIASSIIIHVIKGAKGVMLESHYVINKVSNIRNDIYWLPNSREIADDENTFSTTGYSKRFVFISQVKEEKGIEYILKLNDELKGAGYIFDIYGPIAQSKYSYFENVQEYKGVLDRNEIFSTLRSYDVLILPTYYLGEGYPGIIIEAYIAGRPVISTKWKAIPELVEEGVTGFLSEVNDYNDLKEKVLMINNDNYARIAKNAFEKGKQFNSEKVHNELFKYIFEKE